MNTSKSYRRYRLFYNQHAGDFGLFGSRVNNPYNYNGADPRSETSGALLRTVLAVMAVLAVVALSLVS